MFTWLTSLFKVPDRPVYHYYSGKTVFESARNGRRTFVETLYKTEVRLNQTWRLRETASGCSWITIDTPRWYTTERTCKTPYTKYNTLNTDFVAYIKRNKSIH